MVTNAKLYQLADALELIADFCADNHCSECPFGDRVTDACAFVTGLDTPDSWTIHRPETVKKFMMFEG